MLDISTIIIWSALV